MASRDYSFLDIAVLDGVRSRFAAGDALAVLTIDLKEVVWANGPGAALFGYRDIEEIMGADAELPFATRRQIMAAPGYPDIGSERSITVRLASGLTSRTVGFLASHLILPGGEAAILLAVPSALAGSHNESEIAERAIAGFRGAGHFAALIDGQGAIVAASSGFAGLGLTGATLSALAQDVRQAPDRLVKRLIPAAGTTRLPAGLARLMDDPLLALLVVIGEDQSETAPSTKGPETVAEAVGPGEHRDRNADRDKISRPVGDAPAQPEHDHWYFNAGEDRLAAGRERAPAQAEQKAQISEQPTAILPPENPAPENTAPENTASDEIAIDRNAAPVRFVWRTDAEGRFSAISEEFAGAVGEAAADVVGRRFGDVAMIFGFDSDKDIVGLLERRDTWSGRSVLWPVVGKALKIPVDLAALPTYSRSREFEGFRGFGVARPADAVADPEGIGLTLTPDYRPPDQQPPADATDTALPPPADETGGHKDPFEGEVPALAITRKAERRQSDKIIRLAEHRPPTTDKGLTAVEKNAFREIGDRLKKESAPESPSEHSSERPLPGSNDNGVALGKGERPAPGDEGRPQAAAGGDAESIADVDDNTPEVLQRAEAEAADQKSFTETSPQESETTLLTPETIGHGQEQRPVVDTTILDRLPVPVLIHSGDALHYANRDFLEFTAYASIEDLADRGGLDALFGEPYRDETDNERTDRKLRLRRGDGLELPVEARLQSVPWKGGKALLLALRKVGRMPVLTPVPGLSIEQKLELESRIAELSTIIDTATDGVVLIANDGTIRSISRPAEALFGIDSGDVAGKPFTALFAMESQKAARDYLNGLSENGVASVLNDGREVIGREAQGRFIPLFMTIGKLPNLGGYCAVLRDITQWKRAEEELTQSRTQAERASSQKTDFLARVSHEIRTPLNAIIGFSELMVDEKFGPIGNDRYRDYLRDINRSGNHVLDLVNDLLDISKIEAGEQEMAYEAVSLNDTLGETVAMMQPQANRERVIIRSSFASRLPEVVADLRSVRQIALNLLSNAVRYTQAGGQVIVSTSYEASGDVVMRVRDTGIGMSMLEIEQALKPFKQINALKRARGDGTGLGLPLTKAMVEANRAKFTISSTPGEGTLVEITFPSTRVLAE